MSYLVAKLEDRFSHDGGAQIMTKPIYAICKHSCGSASASGILKLLVASRVPDKNFWFWTLIIVKLLKIRTPEKYTVIILKFDLYAGKHPEI